MKLGVVVTDINQSQLALETIWGALDRAWSVRCFLTEDAVNMVKDARFVDMARHEQSNVSMCEHSAERYCKDVDLEAIGDVIVVGGQYQDAELVRHSEQVLVF